MAGKKDEQTKLCFVVGPIGADDGPQRIHADWLLEFIIHPVMAEFPRFETKRADQISTPGMIDAQVINALLNADLVIADLSTQNPNAFYEIGIRHMAQKPIIHMQLAEETIPFDVSLYRAIKYSRTRPRDIRAAQEALKAQVNAATSDGYQIENPVTRTRGVVALEQGATSGEKVLLEQLRSLGARLSALEHERNARVHISSSYDDLNSKPLTGSTLVTFITGRQFMPEQDRILRQALTRQYGLAVRISRTPNEITFAIPGDANINDFEIPGGLPKDLEISPLRPYPGSP